MQNRQIFIDNQLDADFKNKGYLIVDLIDKVTAKILYKVASALNSGVQATFYTSLWSKDAKYRNQADNLINKEIGIRVMPFFNNYKPFFGDLLIKKPSLNKDYPIHQDWTFVDEHEFTSIFVWCPLQDVNYLNGNLQVVEKSHRILDKIRGANIEVSYKDIISDIRKYLKSVPLKAGQAIIFNQALLHASPPNRSMKTRIALGLVMVPNEATIFHYFLDKENKEINRIEANKEFFMKYGEQVDFQNALKNSNFVLDDKFVKEKVNVNFDQMSLTTFKNKINELV